MAESEEKIPWSRPVYWGDELTLVKEAMESTWISGGPFVEQLEQQFSTLCNGAMALSTSNGTAALYLAFLAIDIKPDDEIVVPGFGFLAAANVALHIGAKPVFCEVDPRTWCSGADEIESVLTSRTRAIVVVHTYGNVCDMNPILKLARDRNISVIEDTAEALASKYRGQFAGTLGTIGTYSFHATKTITTGEGGMVITDNDKLLDRMKLYRSHGLKRKKHYWHELPGLNFRLTNIQAALGCGQLQYLEKIITERNRVYNSYREKLMEIPGVLLQEFLPVVEPVVWAIAIQLDPKLFPQGRDVLLEQMLELGIELRPGFYSPGQIDYFECAPLPICDNLASSIVSMPSYPSLSEAQIESICARLAALGHG
jgi:perosamine synthetase